MYSSQKEYVGIGGMSGAGNQVWDFDSNYDYTHRAVSIKFGTIESNGDRFEGAMNVFVVDGDSGWTDVYTGLEANYLYVIPTPVVKPYVSVGVGYYISSSMTTYNGNTQEEEQAESYTLNFGVGAVFEIGKYIELEATYQYRYFTWNTDSYYVNDNMSNVYIGMNIKF